MPNIRNVDLNLLAVFDALFDERSVTRAAARLSLTQPTVSGMLQRLRRTFSDQLFLRGSHGIVSTPRAEALAGPIKELLARAELLLKLEAFDPATAEGTIKLCASDYLQHAVIAPLIEELRRRAPKLKVLVSPRQAATLAELLTRGEIDLCVTLREAAEPDLPVRELYRDRYVCVARKSHPLKTRSISTRQLCAYDHVVVDPTGRSLSGPLDAVLADAGHKRRVAVAVPSFQVLFELLNSDDFIAFVPERLLRKRKSAVRIFATNLSIPPVDVIATWHPRLNDDVRHQWLLELLAVTAGPNR